MYPFVGWWLERGESTADLVRRAHQQKLFHFCALRRFGAALHCGKMACVVGRKFLRQRRLLPLECKLWLTMKTVLAQRVRAWDAYLEGIMREVLRALAPRGRSSCYKSQLPFSRVNRIL